MLSSVVIPHTLDSRVLSLANLKASTASLLSKNSLLAHKKYHFHHQWRGATPIAMPIKKFNVLKSLNFCSWT